ncbi:hypothetical protein HRbin17_00577 [bacterium HR17]|uniref:Uncharacterized protein n=1 Tax=Candidatus Fervidibacter japonicus TaxID=2035412 RepID=A0A2H5XA65_9BACT|nr:hypothetical protein HRbin17_00577 [bacterium HR17]
MRLRSTQFLLFGMGSRRRKIAYVSGGKLLDAWTLEPIRQWQVATERIEPSEYRVTLIDLSGKEIVLFEDTDGVWLRENGRLERLTTGERVNLPSFEGHPFAAWLRALHAEILVNITPFGPVPNLWVYPRPWYRDAAMALMVLTLTGNLHLIEGWVMGLRSVFDRNNGYEEPDNIGQVLYMVGLFGAKEHPIVPQALNAIDKFRRGEHIVGLTDFAEHPVYQTKWLKFGLRALSLDDPFKIPPIPDPYSALFWMDFREHHIPCERFSAHTKMLYPYLAWAEAHFYDELPPEALDELVSPLTWEAQASQAEYWRLKALADASIIADDDVCCQVARPHSWHAAEMFLYLHERDA